MRALALPRGDWLLIVAGAILLTIAYPPFHLLLPSFVCLAPAIWLIIAGESDARPLRRHLVQGFWFGLVSNGLVLYWMVTALWRFTRLAVLGYVATIAILAVFSAALFALVGWVRRRTALSLLLLFPLFWTTVEWIVGHLGDIRFPWLGLGTSLTGYPTVVQIAEVVGARGVTLLLALANTALALTWVGRRDRRRAALLIAGVLVGVVLATGYGITRERAMALREVGTVSVLQPNVGFREKWDGARDSVFEDILGLSERALRQDRPQLVVWPEVAVPGYFHQHPRWEPRIAVQARETGTPLVVGGLDVIFYSAAAGDYDIYNSAFLFDSSGQREAYPAYHKQYLVPITERVPFINPRWVNLRWFGGFGVGERGAVYRLGIGAFGILICYESAFEDLSRDYRRRGADFVLNITNDDWFGDTSAPYQHAAHLVMRAIENRVGIARAANSGISEFVDPLGREHHRTALGVKTFVTDTLVTSDALTIYTRLGDWVGWGVVLLSVLILGYARWETVGGR